MTATSLANHLRRLKSLAFRRQGQKMKEIRNPLSEAIARLDATLKAASPELYEDYSSKGVERPEYDPRSFDEEVFGNIRSQEGLSDFHYHATHLLVVQRRTLLLLGLLESMSRQGIRTWEDWDRLLDLLVALEMEVFEHLGYHMGTLRVPLQRLLESLQPGLGGN